MSEPIVVTIKIPADFDGPLTFTLTPHWPDPASTSLPPTPPEPQAEAEQ